MRETRTRCQWCSAIVVRNDATETLKHQWPECERYKQIQEDARTCAPVLARMVQLLGAKGATLTMGQALDQARKELRIKVPEHMIPKLLTNVFHVISGGRLPGQPDA